MATPNARARQPVVKSSPPAPQRGGQSRELLNYRLGERVGQEELATIYRATHLTLDRPVIVAVLRRSDWVSVSRFQMAMKLGAKLSHPNLLPVIDAGHDEHYGDYMVTPKLDTRTLQEVLASGPLEPLIGLRVFVQIGQAIEYLHSQTIVHRDLQPINILVTPQGAAYLSNFSLAASPETPDFSGVHEADFRTVYSAPEQDFTSNRIAPAHDLYSLGAVAYQMFTGELPPMPGTDLGALATRNPALAGVERVLARLLAPDPAQRYGSATQAIAAMNQALRALRDEATDDMQESRWEPTAEWLDNPLELAIAERIDGEFMTKSRARADTLHRVDAIKRQLDRWSRQGFLRRPLLGQSIQPEQIVSYNLYIYEVRAHYERRTAPQPRQTLYTGKPIEPFARKAEVWEVVLPEYEAFVDAAAEQVPLPGSRQLTVCPDCSGAKKMPCKSCAGKGSVGRTRKVTDSDGKSRNEPFEEPCPTCHGYGQRECQRCQGHGQLLEESIFTWSRFGKFHRNEDDLSGLHQPTVERLAKPVFSERIDPYDGRWYQVEPLKELLEEALKAGGEDARMLTAELTIRGVPVTEVDYRLREKNHTLTLVGFENTIRGDMTLVDVERAALYGVILLLTLALVLVVVLRLI
ncbi:MAG: protein kinase [Roseiflexaceae bacterium]|nr:protein kinase [Roseiflexaceae bacterium]